MCVCVLGVFLFTLWFCGMPAFERAFLEQLMCHKVVSVLLDSCCRTATGIRTQEECFSSHTNSLEIVTKGPFS